MRLFLFSSTLLAMIATLIVYWLARHNQMDNKINLPSSMFQATPDDHNYMFADIVITTALSLGILIVFRNILKK